MGTANMICLADLSWGYQTFNKCYNLSGLSIRAVCFAPVIYVTSCLTVASFVFQKK